MKRIACCFLLLAASSLSSPITLRADPIGRSAYNGDFGTSGLLPGQIRYVIGFRSRFGGPLIATAFDIVIGPEDVGRSFLLSSGPDFAASTQFLTDGVTESVVFQANGSGPSFFETFLFSGDATSRGGDFAGFAISSLELRIDELALDRPGHDPNRDGLWTDVRLRSTLTVNGTQLVPEPATVGLLSIGLLGLCVRGIARRTRLTDTSG